MIGVSVAPRAVIPSEKCPSSQNRMGSGIVFNSSGRTFPLSPWCRWTLGKLANLSVVALPQALTQTLASAVERSMALTCTIQDGHVWIATGDETHEWTPEKLLQGT